MTDGANENLIREIATSTNQTVEFVSLVVQTLRETVDALFLDGYSIVTSKFTLVYEDDPTIELLNAKIDTATPEQMEALYCGEAEEISAWLGISVDEYLRHPVGAEGIVLAHLADRLGVGEANLLDHPVARIAEAWLDVAPPGRDHVLSKMGLERDLEDWLVRDPTPIIRRVGQAVRLSSRQLRLPDRRRPDLVYDLLEGDEVTGTLIVELKAVGGYPEAVDQVVGYLDAFEQHNLGGGDVLYGLLIADGFPPDVLTYARERDIDVATLSEIGYRRGLGFASVDEPVTRWTP